MEQRDIKCIENILYYCCSLERTIKRFGSDFATLEQDVDYQNSVSFNILQIGELCGSLSESFREANKDSVPWKSAKGMRNMIVHDYLNSNLEIIWNTALHNIPQLKNFCESILSQIQ